MAGCVALTQAQVEQVLSQVSNKRDRCLLLVGLHTGFRISELLSLRICDVFQAGRVVSVLKVARKNMKGKVASREVPLHPRAQEAIVQLLADMACPETCPLFQSRNGDKDGNRKALSRTQAIVTIKEMIKLAGVQGQVASHCLRKTFSAKIYRALGNDLFATSKALGHSDIRNTVRYLPIDNDAIAAAILAA